MRSINPAFIADGPTIFTTMSRLATKHQAINLGQGFPEDGWSVEILAKAAEYLLQQSNQYPPMTGVAALKQAVAAHDRHYWKLPIDENEGVVITAGATEALAAAIFALVENGDEVVVFEPFFDSYLPILQRAGAIVRLVRIESPDWQLDAEKLRQAFSAKTKMVLLNTPMNPIAKVFSLSELQLIADLTIEFDCYVLSDEVYEHIVFSGNRHIPIASLDDMFERSLRIGSAGKSFSLTGWKIGWITGAAPLVQAVARAHQFLTFTVPPNLQNAVAFGLTLGDRWFEPFLASLAQKRNRLIESIERLQIPVLPCQGTYFVTIDLGEFRNHGENAADFCKRMTVEGGLATIPLTALYKNDGPENLIRLCFAKTDANLDQGVERLARFIGRA